MTRKLTPEQVVDIFVSCDRPSALGRRYGISRFTVTHIKAGFIHIHLTAELERGFAPRGRPRNLTPEQAEKIRAKYLAAKQDNGWVPAGWLQDAAQRYGLRNAHAVWRACNKSNKID